MSVASNHSKLWQNYSDCNHMLCGSLLWLNFFCPFTFRNIASWLAVIFKKQKLSSLGTLSKILRAIDKFLLGVVLDSGILCGKSNFEPGHSSPRLSRSSSISASWRNGCFCFDDMTSLATEIIIEDQHLILPLVSCCCCCCGGHLVGRITNWSKIDFFSTFSQTTLLYLQQMALLGFFPTTLYRGAVIRTHGRVAPTCGTFEVFFFLNIGSRPLFWSEMTRTFTNHASCHYYNDYIPTSNKNRHMNEFNFNAVGERRCLPRGSNPRPCASQARDL